MNIPKNPTKKVFKIKFILDYVLIIIIYRSYVRFFLIIEMIDIDLLSIWFP